MEKTAFFFLVTFLVGAYTQTCPDQDAALVSWTTQFGSATDVVIQASQKIKFDTTITINTLQINGTLVFDDSKNVGLTAHWIKVNPGGKLQIGSSTCPYTHKATITFTGAYTNTSEMGTDPSGGALGTKGLAITSGATLEIFGAVPTKTWTRLAVTALANSTTITVEDAVSWSVGNQIVIASTDFSAASNVVPDQSEQNEILSISGTTITLKYPLTYMHWADQQGWERAEVGLLTRNIVIQGDNTSESVGFGGHMIVRKASSVHVYGAEFYRMGQKGILGRYPIHLHLMKDQVGKGFYASYNSIHRSYQRCIAIHDGQGLTATNNVAFNITGHCYFLEDGPEQLNTFDRNLGVRVNVGALIPSDAQPAVFWITNPNNTYTNNVAVGGAFGFWYSLPMHPVGASEPDYASDLWVWPRYTPLALFDKNVGHSNSKSGLFIDNMLEPDGSTPLGSYTPRQGHYNYTLSQSYNYPSVVASFTNFIGYKCREHGVWTRGGPIIIDNAVLLDNTNAVTCVPGPSMVVNSLIVGETSNIGTMFNYYGLVSMNRSRPVYYTNNYPVTGWSTYDNGGPQFARNITFKNFTTNSFRGAGAITTLPNAPFMLWATDKLEDLKFENANPVYLELFPNSYSTTKNDMTNGANIIDNDGTVTGEYGSWIVSDTPFMLRGDCQKKDAWNAWYCPKFLEGYTQIRIDTPTFPNVSDHFRSSWHLLGNASHPFLNVTGSGTSGSPDFLWTVNLIPFRAYTPRWAEATPASMQISLGGSTTKEWVIVALPYPTGTTFTITVDYSNTKVKPVTSLDQLNNKYEYFYDSSSQHLYVFLQSLDETAGEIWNFSYHSSYNSFVNIAATCPGGVCKVGTPSYGTSNPSPALPPVPPSDLVYFRAKMEGCRLSPAVQSSFEGVALAAFDPLTGLLTYNIHHTINAKATRVFLGSGFNDTAAEYMQLVGSKSPIKGSVYISQQKLNDLISGKLFVTIESSDHPTGELRGYFGCDSTSSADCQISLTTTDPASFCSLPSNSSFVIYSDGALVNSWKNWSWGNTTVNFADNTTYVCGNSSLKVLQPGVPLKGQLQLGHSPVFAVDTNTYKYLSFFIKAEGSFKEELQLYVQVSNSSGVWYPDYRIKREEISSFAVDNAAWGQVLIDLNNLGLGSGNQTIYAMTIATHYWNSKQVILFIDEIQFLPAYTPTTKNAVTVTPTLYDGTSCKPGGGSTTAGTTAGSTGDGGSQGESSAPVMAMSLWCVLFVTLALLL